MGIEALIAAIPELFSVGAADAGAMAAADVGATALADVGATALADVGAATSMADIVGTGTGLFGGATGLEGTALASGFTGGMDALTATTGLGALGTAADFLAAPGASGLTAAGPGFGATADAAASQAASSGLASGPADILGTSTPGAALSAPVASIPQTPQPQGMGGVTSSANLSPSVANANAGASVFETGAAPITASPGASNASALAAPAGVTSPLGVDPTAAATSTASAATPAAPAATSLDSLLGKAGSGVMNSLTSNPLGIALGAAGLGYNVLSGQKQSANQKALSSAADTAANTGKQALDAGLPMAKANNTTGTGLINSGQDLQTYLSTGKLPPQYQQQVDQAINDAKIRAISNAASQGVPTDPARNTALAATLAGIDNQRGSMTTQIAQSLFNAGSSNINAGSSLTSSSASSLINAGQSASGLSANLLQALVQNDTTQAQNTGKAIATLAAALNNKSSAKVGGINISTG